MPAAVGKGQDLSKESLPCRNPMSVLMLTLPIEISGSVFILRMRSMGHLDLPFLKDSWIGFLSTHLWMNTEPNVEEGNHGSHASSPSPRRPYPILHYDTLCRRRRQTINVVLVMGWISELWEQASSLVTNQHWQNYMEWRYKSKASHCTHSNSPNTHLLPLLLFFNKSKRRVKHQMWILEWRCSWCTFNASSGFTLK